MKIISLSKKSQSEIIVTVLLIMVGLAAMIVLSGFVINLVKDKMKAGDCVKTLGGISIVNDDVSSYFDIVNKKVFVSIERGEASFDLEAIKISVGNENQSKVYTVALTGSSPEVTMKDSSAIALPKQFEIYTYVIRDVAFSSVDRVKIVPVLPGNLACSQGMSESKISSK